MWRSGRVTCGKRRGAARSVRLATRWLVYQVAACRVPAANLVERRRLTFATFPCMSAPVAKAAAGRPGGRRRYGAGNCREALARCAKAGHGAEQANCIRMLRVGEQFLHGSFLNHLPA